MWRKNILPFFLFNKKERRGIYLLLLIISAMWIIPFFFSSPVSPITIDELTVIESARDSLLILEGKTTRFPLSYTNRHRESSQTESKSGKKPLVFSPKSLFYFDPNTATEADWRELGIPGKTIATMQKYLAKGGRFRKPEDLIKIYNFPEEAYDVLYAYVRIAESQKIEKKKSLRSYQDNKAYLRKDSEIRKVDINQADSAQWEALPGIGPTLAARIILFRKKLGGFYSIRQVAETYGLPDSIFQKIKPYLEEDILVPHATLDINHASQQELQAHPYFSFQLARLIIAYRNQHGPFKQKSELNKLAVMTPELFTRLEPYVSLY